MVQMTQAATVDLLTLVLLALTIIALTAALYGFSVARRAIREARTYALTSKWEIENIRVRELSREEGEEVESGEGGEQKSERPSEAEQAQMPSVRAYSSLIEMISGMGLDAVMLFDSMGRPIEHVGVDEVDQKTALLAELVKSIGIGSEYSFAILASDSYELLSNVERFDTKDIYLYARSRSELTVSKVDLIMRSAKLFLSELTTGRLGR